MSKKIIFPVLAFFALSTFALTTTAFAQNDRHGLKSSTQKISQTSTGYGMIMSSMNTGNDNFDGMGGRFHKGISEMKSSLTPAQQANFDKITERFIAETNPIKVQLASKSAEYSALLLNTNPNPTEAGKLAGEISKLRQDLEAAQMNYLKTLETKFGSK